MKSNKWYRVKNEQIEVFKMLWNEWSEIEFTFSNDYKRIKKTIWKKGKPQI